MLQSPSFSAFGQAISELLDRLSIGPRYIYLHDYGAPVGFHIAMQAPERVLGLIVQNANAHRTGLGPPWDETQAPYWSQPTPENEAAATAHLTFEGTRGCAADARLHRTHPTGRGRLICCESCARWLLPGAAPDGMAAERLVGAAKRDESPWRHQPVLRTIPRLPRLAWRRSAGISLSPCFERAYTGRSPAAWQRPCHILMLDPMTTAAEIMRMSSTDRISEAMRRSLPFVPGTARSTVEAMLRPETLAIVAGTLVVWAGSHFIGIGEIVDVVLLTVGVVTLGFAVFEGADELYQFAKVALAARTEGELDDAGRHFARAVTLLGISTIQAVLLRGQGRAVLARGRPQVLPRINPGAPPPAGNQLRLSRPARLSGGTLGETDAYGAISVARNQPLSEQRLTLLHELVHRYFSPRTGPLRQLRAELNISGYSRSALLRYLEEALAEGYAQLRVHGLEKALAAYRFPLAGPYPYVTVSQLIGEGRAIGTIMLGGTLFYVSITQ